MEARDMVEVWQNTAAGMRWYTALDRQGREMEKTVQGGRTFTLTPFDRQINQDMAANSDLDLFRNGTFVLVKAAGETEMDEIESSDSFTDAELSVLVNEMLAKNKTPEEALASISSPVTLGRLHTALVLADAPSSMRDAVKAKKNEQEPTVAVEREYVATVPKEPEVKTPRDIPEIVTEPIVKTEPVRPNG